MQQSSKRPSQDTKHIEGEEVSIAPLEGMLQPGQVLQNRYRILGTLGIGGMGAVYQARDLHFPSVTKLCAVKEMINVATDQGLREQMTRNFEREAEILATLSHPAVPQIYDYFSFGDRAYLVMEYIQGKDLEAVMNSIEQLLPVEQVRKWAIEICDVLHYLHTHQPPIIFRDMKPSNIMIDHHQRVRLIDFGIAKAFQPGGKQTMIGTEGYSPPEQYKGEASPAGDIYALGATLHHLLTGSDPRLEPPFSFEDRPVRSLNPEVSDRLASIVMRSLDYDVGKRFPNAEIMKEALESLEPAGGFPPGEATEAAQTLSGVAEAFESSFAPEGVIPIWVFQAEDEIRSSPIVVDNVVYFGGYDNNLWAIEAKTGKQVWKFPTDGLIGSSPAYLDGIIYIGSKDRRLYAVNVDTGQTSWTFLTEGPIYTTPCVALGHVYFGSDDGYLYALRASTGRRVWAFPTDREVRSSPTVSGERVFFGNDSGDFYALNASGEETAWHFKARRAITSSPMVQDQIIYFGSDDWTMYAFDVERGFSIWRFRTHKQVISSPRFFSGMVYFGSADGSVYALDALSGRQIWEYETEGQVNSTPFVNERGVYVGSLDGHLYCLHPDTGDLLWRFQSDGGIISSPVIYDNIVYVGSTDHKLYALPS
jgi:outer membrane protein assembly factor BamB/tRNA A-37 threonylcarbamoyl transferase component Bud32